MLTINDHDRDKAGLTYVYPVLSRRSGGLSIGINLNINNACNWRCIYCQVPDLIRGAAPQVNFDLFGRELRRFLADVIHGDFYDREEVPDEMRIIKDIAISGNGEPTTSGEFNQVVNSIEMILKEYGLLGDIKCVLITNGSMIERDVVQKGLRKLNKINGEVWFKIDSATPSGMALINNTRGGTVSILNRLQVAAALCPTWIQSCFFSYKNRKPAAAEIEAYLKLMDAVEKKNIPIKGVMLYGVARDSLQPEAKYISSLPESWFEELAVKMNRYGFDLRITP